MHVARAAAQVLRIIFMPLHKLLVNKIGAVMMSAWANLYTASLQPVEINGRRVDLETAKPLPEGQLVDKPTPEKQRREEQRRALATQRKHVHGHGATGKLTDGGGDDTQRRDTEEGVGELLAIATCCSKAGRVLILQVSVRVGRMWWLGGGLHTCEPSRRSRRELLAAWPSSPTP